MAVIKEITALETYPVRLPVLRVGKPMESCAFEGDDLATTKHLGLYSDGNLVGVITVLKNHSALFREEEQFQIRGMAVLDSFQKRGFGEYLLQFAEKYIKKQEGRLIWFNARTNAMGFYERSGYSIKGSIFEIQDVGPHYVMFKELG